MLSLLYAISILILNQLLYVVINAQQDLEIKPIVSKYSTNQFISSNTQPVVTNTYNHINLENNSPRQETTFEANYNIPKNKLYQSLISYYDTITPIAINPIQGNLHLSDKYNWNFITEQRSKSFIPSYDQPPIELHHGYRYIEPAISFSSNTNLNNVIYNELGLSENHNDLLSLPKGFTLQQPQTEFQIKNTFAPGNINSVPKVSSYPKNINYQNSTNITILTPAKNLIFSYNYSQPHKLNTSFKETNIFNQPSLNHTLNTEKKMESQFTTKPSYSSGYNEVFNSTSNLYTLPRGQFPQNLKTGIMTPETYFQSDALVNEMYFGSNFTNTDILQKENNVYPDQKKLSLNIKPSVELFQNIQPGIITVEESTQSSVKLDEIYSNYSQTEHKKILINGYYQYFSQNNNLQEPSKNSFISNKKNAENSSHGIVFNTANTNTIVTNFNNIKNHQSNYNIEPSNSSYGQNCDKISSQTNLDKHPIGFIHENGQTNQQSVFQNLYFDSNTISPSEYSQHYYTTSQQEYMPVQKVFHDTFKNNQQNTLNESKLSTNVPNNKINLSHSVNPLIKNEQNKIPNKIFIKGQRVTNPVNKEKTFQNSQSQQKADGEQNKLIFPTNLFLTHSSNIVSKLPIESNRYHYSKIKGSNGITSFSSNTQMGNPEQNYQTPFLNNHGQNNTYKLVDENYTNQMYTVQILQPYRKIPQNTSYLNNLNNINSITEQPRPGAEIINEQIDPRTANYPKETEQPRPEPAITTKQIDPGTIKYRKDTFINNEEKLHGFEFPSHYLQPTQNYRSEAKQFKFL